jgi:NADH-quinone oxidoreductase subunit N
MPAYLLEVIIVSLGILLLLAEAFFPRVIRPIVGILALVGLAVVFVLGRFVMGSPEGMIEEGIWRFYSASPTALYFKGLIIVATVFSVWFTHAYRGVLLGYVHGHVATGEQVRDGEDGLAEFYALQLFACAGLMWMASARDVATMFLALELATISFYILVSYMRRNVGSLEAGVKYLILGAMSTGFLVYGMAWLFGVTGTIFFREMPEALAGLEGGETVAPLFALGLILVGLGFKIAAVPFHFWAPDVYQGAPTPVTALLAVGSKAGGFILLTWIVGIFASAGGVLAERMEAVLLAMAVFSILVGGLGALGQTNLKRLLGYSSIGNAGFALLALASFGGGDGLMASGRTAAFFLASYAVGTLLCLGVVVYIRSCGAKEDLTALRGLGRRNPLVAALLTLGLLSLAGIPFTVGFMGKLAVFVAAIGAGHHVVVGFAIAGAALGFYYYLRPVRMMYWEQPDAGEDALSAPLKGLGPSLLVLAGAVLFFGLLPAYLEPKVPIVAGEIDSREAIGELDGDGG